MNFCLTNSKHRLELLVEVVLGLVVVLSFCLFLLLSIPIYLFRFAVIIYVKFFRQDLDSILNGMSAYLVNDYFDNKTPRANIVTSIIIRGHVTLQELKHLVISQWIETNDTQVKRFSQYPVRWMGFTFYKKAADSFQINNHVHLYPKGKQRIVEPVTKEDLLIFSENLLNSSFTPFKSPWEVHLIQNYKNEKFGTESEKYSVLVFKVHHSLTDGFGIVSAFVQAFSQQTLGDLSTPKPIYKQMTWWEKLSSCILLALKLIPESGRFVTHTMRSSSWRVIDDKKHWYQLSFRSESIPLQKLHKIRKAFGISLSSIMYSAISAGIQKSLHDSMDTCQNQISDIVPTGLKDSSIYCVHVMPLPGHPLSLTNHVTWTFLDLPIRKYNNPIDRLHDVDLALTSGCENSPFPWIFPMCFYIVGCHFYPILRFILKNRTLPVGVTNFAVPPLHFITNEKKPVAVNTILGALDGVAGVAVGFIIFDQCINVFATAEKCLMSREDINRFGKHIVNEIERLFLMACSGTE